MANVNLSLKSNMVYNKDLPTIDNQYYNIKPFLPGLKINNTRMYTDSVNSPYHPNKVAGVDSIGLS